MKTIYPILEELEKGCISADTAEYHIDEMAQKLFNDIITRVTEMVDSHDGSTVGLSNNISQLHINQFIK